MWLLRFYNKTSKPLALRPNYEETSEVLLVDYLEVETVIL